jgi:putative FmdB family regulatory protein
MPTYVYACDTCGKQFEQVQSFKDEPLKVCPCGDASHEVRRVFQPVGIVFKGTGWYINDSRSTDNTAANSKSSTDESTTTSDTKSDSPKDTAPSDAGTSDTGTTSSASDASAKPSSSGASTDAKQAA